jgi:hypothetical protein
MKHDADYTEAGEDYYEQRDVGEGWWGVHMAGSAGFVGRERELALLRAAAGGDARLVLVAGDAGVGKTRLVAEAMRLAAAEGILRLWGGCLPLAEKLPLLPVREEAGWAGWKVAGCWRRRSQQRNVGLVSSA